MLAIGFRRAKAGQVAIFSIRLLPVQAVRSRHALRLVRQTFLMPRQARYRIEGLPQHVIQRGNNRVITFRADGDYAVYRRYLGEALEKHGCTLHAYCLMTNHVHLLITPHAASSIPKMIQSVSQRYVRYFNRAYARTGTLWEGRYKASLIQDDTYALTCYRYIELNPVRAGLVAHPALYRHSSYLRNALGHVDPLVCDHPVYRALAATQEGSRAVYRRLVDSGLTQIELQRIRETTASCQVLGSEDFKDRVERLLNHPARPRPRGRRKPNDGRG